MFQFIIVYPNSISFTYLVLNWVNELLFVKLDIIVVRTVAFCFSLFLRELVTITVITWRKYQYNKEVFTYPTPAYILFCIAFYFLPEMSYLYKMAVTTNCWNVADNLSFWSPNPINTAAKKTNLSQDPKRRGFCGCLLLSVNSYLELYISIMVIYSASYYRYLYVSLIMLTFSPLKWKFLRSWVMAHSFLYPLQCLTQYYK